MSRVRFLRFATRLALLAATLVAPALCASQQSAGAAPAPPANSASAPDAAASYSPQDQARLGLCAAISDNVLTIASGKRAGKPAAEFKSYYGRQPGMVGALMPATVDRVYAQDIPSDWSFTIEFFQECTRNMTPVPPARMALATYCMQNRMVATLAVAARNGGVSRQAVQDKFSALNSASAVSIVDAAFATPQTQAEAQVAAWEPCIGLRLPATSHPASRSLDNLRSTLAANAAQIHQLYIQASKAEPGLKGKVVVQFTIAPDGHVASAQTLSSELHWPQFEERVLALIRTMDFGAADVAPLVATYPLDFAPT